MKNSLDLGPMLGRVKNGTRCAVCDGSGKGPGRELSWAPDENATDFEWQDWRAEAETDCEACGGNGSVAAPVPTQEFGNYMPAPTLRKIQLDGNELTPNISARSPYLVRYEGRWLAGMFSLNYQKDAWEFNSGHLRLSVGGTFRGTLISECYEIVRDEHLTEYVNDE